MRPLIQEVRSDHSPESLADRLRNEPGLVLLRSPSAGFHQARYSFLAVRPFLTFRSFRSRCELLAVKQQRLQTGDPWVLLDRLMAKYEIGTEVDVPFPLGGCFGYWGYDLRHFVEPGLPRRPRGRATLPDCYLGFYDSLVVFDHWLGKTLIVSTGLREDGARSRKRALQQLDFWRGHLESPDTASNPSDDASNIGPISSNLSRADFIARVKRAQRYIRSGDIYQVNLSQRLTVQTSRPAWELFKKLSAVSPAPFSAHVDCGEFQIVSSSPELFLRLSGRHVETRPIKGTRPRSPDELRDLQLAAELQTSPKERAELVMITDLLRNDLGKIAEFGSVRVPDLAGLERFAHVQHLVSTVEARLRPSLSHCAALASCFPGGSVTGAPKFRAMEIIDELETTARGPYTGALGYLGFNNESQVSIIIRTAICTEETVSFHTGAGIVADSDPEAEYEETLAKARGFVEVLTLEPTPPIHKESYGSRC